MDGVRICYIGINVNFASIVNECKMQIKYVGGSMKQRTWKALLAIALVLVLTLSLVPLGAAAPGAASAAPDTTDPQTAPEAELRAQTEDVNQTAPAPARRPGVTQRRRKTIPSTAKAAGESRRLLVFPMRCGDFTRHSRGGPLVSRGFGRRSFCSARPG